MMKYLLIALTFCSIILISCQSDQKEGKGTNQSRQQTDAGEERQPASLEIVDAEFEEEGTSEYMGHILGRNTRYHIVEARKGTLLELQLTADMSSTKVNIIKPRGGILWSETVRTPNEPVRWSGELPAEGKFTIEISLTGKAEKAGVACRYTLQLKKST